MEEQKKSNSAVLWSVVIFIVAVGAYAIFQFTKTNTPPAQAPVDTTTQTPPDTTTNSTTTLPVATPPDTQTSASTYKDGVYSSIGDYFSPGGAQQLGVQVTLKADVITDAQVVPKPADGTSSKYQGIFAANYKQYVVGKKLDDVVLTKVSGSSLTPKGWNDAIAKIQVEAKA